MTDISMDALANSIAALAHRRLTFLDALEQGTSVPGEDDDHLHDFLISLESSLSELHDVYEARRAGSDRYLSYAVLTDVKRT